jgi:hypothetical protein
LRTSLSVVAVIALVALCCSLGIPTEQPATARAPEVDEDAKRPTPARAAVAAP